MTTDPVLLNAAALRLCEDVEVDVAAARSTGYCGADDAEDLAAHVRRLLVENQTYLDATVDAQRLADKYSKKLMEMDEAYLRHRDDMDDLQRERDQFRENAARLDKIRRDYELDYILPTFELAAAMGFDLSQAVIDNPGKNCVVLFFEWLKARYASLKDAIWDVPGQPHEPNDDLSHEMTRRQAVDQARVFECHPQDLNRLVSGFRSHVADIATRIGPARRPEDIKAELESLHASYNVWADRSAEADRDRFLAAIRQHRDERGDDRCFQDDATLYAVLPEGDTRPERETLVTLENCVKYIECRQSGREYVSPQRRIEEMEDENKRLKKAILSFGTNPAGFDWGVLRRIDDLEESLSLIIETWQRLFDVPVPKSASDALAGGTK